MASKPGIKRELSDSGGDKLCSLCYHESRLWAVPPCGHVTCLICATKLRVLCKSKECSVCRETNEKVIVTENCSPFSSFSNQKMTPVKRYGFVFERPSFQRHFESLQTIHCSRCGPDVKFTNMKSLNDHLLKDHNLFTCNICVTHLKLFPHEHKLYSRGQLERHMREGDPHDSSHKGHPLCQFCREHFLDTDALFFHLKNKHFWCHFCEADGKQDYYANYHQLRGHFKESHYLCSEGDCRYEKFTSVFRTKLDFQAHRAKFHSKGLSKSEMKQLRCIEVGFVYNNETGGGALRQRRKRFEETKEPEDIEIAKMLSLEQDNKKDDVPNNLPDPPIDQTLSEPTKTSLVKSTTSSDSKETPLDQSYSLDSLYTSKVVRSSKQVLDNEKYDEWPSLGIDKRIGTDTTKKVVESDGGASVLVKPPLTVNPPPGFVSVRDKLDQNDRKTTENEIFEMAQSMLDHNKKKITRFCNWSSSYQRGDITVDEYYQYCASLFGPAWNSFGIKLSLTIPETKKRQELYSLCKSKQNFTITEPSGGAPVKPPPGFENGKKSMKKVNKYDNSWGVPRSIALNYEEDEFPSLQRASTMPDPVPIPAGWNVKLAVK